VIAETWIVSPPLVAQDLTPHDELHKVIRIFAPSQTDLLYVQCTTSAGGETRIDFLICDDLDLAAIQHAKNLIARVRNLGERERLTTRNVGFGR